MTAKQPPAHGVQEQPDVTWPARGSALQAALADSRNRWRDLATLSSDVAFETDAQGMLTFLAPDPLLGWDAESLLGKPAATLLADPPCPSARDGFDPFRPHSPVRGRRAWLRRWDGAACCLAFSVAPLLDASGKPAGARGVGTDLTDQDRRDASMAAALRRAEGVDHVLARAREPKGLESGVPAVLAALAQALGADGAAVIDPALDGSRAVHHWGRATAGVMDAALHLAAELSGADWDAVAGPLRARPRNPGSASAFRAAARTGLAADGRSLLAAALHLRCGGPLALALWRGVGGRAWDEDDGRLATSVAGVAAVLLEHEAMQREIAMQSRTDPLTGLLNRRAFLEELPRHMARLDRDEMPGTLVFADLDAFKPFNEQLGSDVGDEALRAAASLLRATFRPTDLLARLGGDEFAVWLNGADQLTAAERAEALRVQAPLAMTEVAGPEAPPLTISIGFAERRSRSMEDVDSLFRRADRAMVEVKRAGRAHWRAAAAFEV